MKAKILVIKRRENRDATSIYIGGVKDFYPTKDIVLKNASVQMAFEGLIIKGEKKLYEYTGQRMKKPKVYTEEEIKSKFAKIEWEEFKPIYTKQLFKKKEETGKYTAGEQWLELKEREHFEALVRGNVIVFNETGSDIMLSSLGSERVVQEGGRIQ